MTLSFKQPRKIIYIKIILEWFFFQRIKHVGVKNKCAIIMISDKGQ